MSVQRRHDPLTGETRAQRQDRCVAVAARQASQRGKQRFFEVGQKLGPHTFDGYVGDNPTALYVYLVTGCCGKRITYRRALVNKLDKAECCVDCFRKRRALERKAKAA